MDYDSFISKIASRTMPSELRELFDNFVYTKSHILMAGGLPNSKVFPIKNMQLNLTDGSRLDVNEEDMKQAQQYGNTLGHHELLDFITRLIKHVHDPPSMRGSDSQVAHMVMTTCGAQDAIFKLFETLAEEGDTVITEENTYPNVFAVLNPLGARTLPVKADQHGIIPESLTAALSKWPKPADGKPSKGKLKFLYCVPNGDNPTGARYSVERKRAIYRIAQEYNFIIVEDDAYYFLEERPHNASFLSMDVDSRVIRIDTFSKTVAPGLRLGYICVPKPILLKLKYTSQASTQGSSHLAQFVLIQLLRHWGVDGYIEHCNQVSNFYAARRRVCDQLARKYLTGLAQWSTPTGGMFLWLHISGIADTKPLVMDKVLSRDVLMVAGAAFVDDGVKSPHVRISFSGASDEQMEKGLKILAEEIKKWKENGHP